MPLQFRAKKIHPIIVIVTMLAISCGTLLAVFLGTTAAAGGQDNNTVQVDAPASAPNGASAVVDHHFHSWACAVHFWPDYAGKLDDQAWRF